MAAAWKFFASRWHRRRRQYIFGDDDLHHDDGYMNGDQQVGNADHHHVPLELCLPNDRDLLCKPSDASCAESAAGLHLSRRPAPPVGCTEWPCITNSAPSGGTSNTLADVAQYDYATDLRACNWDTKTDAERRPLARLCNRPTASPASPAAWRRIGRHQNAARDNVPRGAQSEFPNEDDRGHWQHMTTFTLGLGLTGVTQFASDYQDGHNRFKSIDGLTNWPDPGPAIHQNSTISGTPARMGAAYISARPIRRTC